MWRSNSIWCSWVCELAVCSAPATIAANFLRMALWLRLRSTLSPNRWLTNENCPTSIWYALRPAWVWCDWVCRRNTGTCKAAANRQMAPFRCIRFRIFRASFAMNAVGGGGSVWFLCQCPIRCWTKVSEDCCIVCENAAAVCRFVGMRWSPTMLCARLDEAFESVAATESACKQTNILGD